MGYYLNQTPGGHYLPGKGKAKAIQAQFEGVTVLPEQPQEFIPDLVCVVENGPFDAAGYAYSEAEMNVFKHDDGRKKTWLIVPNVDKYAK